MNKIEILKLIVPFIVFELGLKIFSFVHLKRDEVKHLPKWGWALVILLINTLGSLSYLIFGRKRY